MRGSSRHGDAAACVLVVSLLRIILRRPGVSPLVMPDKMSWQSMRVGGCRRLVRQMSFFEVR